MKSVSEIVGFIKDSYTPNSFVGYDEFDGFCGIDGLPMFERQQRRFGIAKRVNTQLRKGQVFSGNDDVVYTSLWVADRGKGFALVSFGSNLLRDSARTFTSASSITDDIIRDLSRALGEESYESKIDGGEVKFRGARPILSNEERALARMHLDTLKLFSPTINTMLGVAAQARKAYDTLCGPLKLTYDGDNAESTREAA
jgi:hypothetical protein